MIEVVSPGHPTKDYTQTPDQCAALGVRELVVFDPMLVGPKTLGNAQRLHVWRCSESGVFERVASGEGPFASEVLGAHLLVTEGGRSLRIVDDAHGSRLWLTEAEAARKEMERALARVRELEAELEKRRG